MDKIGEKKKEILNLLADPHYTAMSQERLGEILGIKQSVVSQHLNELEASDLLEINSSQHGNDIKELTREGYRNIHGGNEPIQGEDRGRISIHKRWIAFSHNSPTEGTDWVENWARSRDLEHRYLGNDQYAVFVENFKYRITSQHVFVMLGEIRGEDAHHLKNLTMAEAFDAVDYLQEITPDSIRVTSRPVELEIHMNQQHVSYIGHPLAELIDSTEGLSLSDVKIYDSQGRERLKFDASHGPELESELPGFGEEDIQTEVDRLRHQIENPELHRWIYEKMPSEVEALRDKTEALEKRLDEVEGSQSATVSDELSVSSKWRDRWGNVMGYSEDLEAPVKLVDAEEI